MKIVKITILVVLVGFISFEVIAQDYEVYDFEGFHKEYMERKDDKIYVINFWATWCKPCVKEMPAFNQLFDKYHDRNVEIILVSLDFGSNIQDRIKYFSNKHDIKSRIVILDDPDSNSWIDRVNENWTGGIPATLIYNEDKREFFEKSFHFEELEKEVLKMINK